MKLVRYGRAGAEKPGLIDEDGAVRDLSRAVEDITPDLLSPAGQRRLRATRTARLPLVRGRVTADEARDPQALLLWTTVNGESRQRGSTANMIFPIRQLVAYVSRFMSLRAGDIVSTGTPAGVAHGMKPPRYLQPGDVVEMGITGLGVQKNRVVSR